MILRGDWADVRNSLPLNLKHPIPHMSQKYLSLLSTQKVWHFANTLRNIEKLKIPRFVHVYMVWQVKYKMSKVENGIHTSTPSRCEREMRLDWQKHQLGQQKQVNLGNQKNLRRQSNAEKQIMALNVKSVQSICGWKSYSMGSSPCTRSERSRRGVNKERSMVAELTALRMRDTSAFLSASTDNS